MRRQQLKHMAELEPCYDGALRAIWTRLHASRAEIDNCWDLEIEDDDLKGKGTKMSHERVKQPKRSLCDSCGSEGHSR
ncbi:hypothetical protein PsorP6_001122 [Peronosclerospora sorghi]|uniref:Uncharacterized protein n=1 Tax=Peronosclerospora sorghi TaxID=230839 RepID=A0ACC0WR07_9STRA|nr:hypothetical protein PsorP6_001122 [Peronosclerospora sorghi]